MPRLVRQIFSARMAVIFLTGFSSGLPLLLIGSTLKAWMTDARMDLTTIGLFSLVGLPYTLKFVWAPLLDRFTIPRLGRRRGWALLAQLALVALLAALAFTDPGHSPKAVGALALVIAFCSASQDIALDAYRREVLTDAELGLGSSLFINGYRLAMLFAGASALYLADQMPWRAVYLVMAFSMSLGILTVLLAPEPEVHRPPPGSMRHAVFAPFADFFRRTDAWWILAFILLYKLGDSMAGEMTMPMYLQLGYTKTEVGVVVKAIGFWATVAGGLLGGVLMLRLCIARSLWLFGAIQAISILGFAVLGRSGISLPMLGAVIGFENVSSGMGTAAYAAYMASITDKRFTATQFALLSSLMGVPRVIMGAPTGWMAKTMGWPWFFVVCALFAIPGMLLLLRIAPWKHEADVDKGT
ncbi:MAG TPA: AmpG family muropeptide MFS transporter [Candidatus Sulfotelmatobacter sp.]|nr:AmpG family muropeptide MFS transporter [Candidatus Sulfotelmatobacter sp.]